MLGYPYGDGYGEDDDYLDNDVDRDPDEDDGDERSRGSESSDENNAGDKDGASKSKKGCFLCFCCRGGKKRRVNEEGKGVQDDAAQNLINNQSFAKDPADGQDTSFDDKNNSANNSRMNGSEHRGSLDRDGGDKNYGI